MEAGRTRLRSAPADSAPGAGPGGRAGHATEGAARPLPKVRSASPAREPAQVSETGVLRAERGQAAAPGASHARQDRVTRARAPGARFDNDGHWNLRRSACRPPCAPPSSESNDRRGFGAPAEARPCSASVERLDRAGLVGTRRCKRSCGRCGPGDPVEAPTGGLRSETWSHRLLPRQDQPSRTHSTRRAVICFGSVGFTSGAWACAVA